MFAPLSRDMTIIVTAIALLAILGLGWPVLDVFFREGRASRKRRLAWEDARAKKMRGQVVELTYPDGIIVRASWQSAVLIHEGLPRKIAPSSLTRGLYSAYTKRPAPEPVIRYYPAYDRA